MKTIPLLLGLLASTCLWEPSASAGDSDPCVEAASKGQQLRDAHQLVEAREQFRLCGTAQCTAAVQGDCATRLADVERSLPSIVLTARDRSGADLVEISVSVDGQPLLQRLNGLSVAVNAGPHTFRFERPGVGSLDRVVTVREGEKHQLVAVTFDVSASPLGPTAQKSAGAGAAPKSAGNSPGKTVGWAMGGAGVVALGLGAISGLIAMVNKGGAHCDSSGVCDPDTVSGIKSAALLSDIGWVAGGVLLAGGFSLILFTPAGAQGQTAAIRLVPVVTPSGGAVVAGARW
jgi:hypothetical protein